VTGFEPAASSSAKSVPNFGFSHRAEAEGATANVDIQCDIQCDTNGSKPRHTRAKAQVFQEPNETSPLARSCSRYPRKWLWGVESNHLPHDPVPDWQPGPFPLFPLRL
jgi:hypothetical protein